MKKAVIRNNDNNGNYKNIKIRKTAEFIDPTLLVFVIQRKETM